MLRCFPDMVTRRSFLGGALAALASTPLVPRSAEATIVRALTVSDMLKRTEHVVVGTSVGAFAQWETIGQRRCIVTYSTFRVEAPLAGSAPSSTEIAVRTLGGTVGNLGQVFHGEAVVALDERATVFLRRSAPDAFSVVAMAQGYYPVKPDAKGIHRLSASFSATEVIPTPNAAMQRLHGLTLPDAEALLAKELELAR
jgi:hypothetical protein